MRRCVPRNSGPRARLTPPFRTQHAAAEAVALLREQLRVREAELATLRAARPGVCARCAEVCLALATHPSFRPTTSPSVLGGAGGAGESGTESAEGPLHRIAALACDLPFQLLLLAAAASAWLSLLDAFALPLFVAAGCLTAGVPRSGWCGDLGGPQARAARASLLLIFWTASGVAALAACLASPSRTACLIAYVSWFSAFDTGQARGARAWPALRRRPLWRHLAEAAQITLRKTGELEKGHKHILCYAPAAHASSAAALAFAAPLAAGWEDAFPGQPTRLALPPASPAMQTPLLREALLALGCTEGNEAGCIAALSPGGALADGGVLCCPMPASDPGAGGEGAGAEASKRLARCALATGAFLVPAYGFGDSSTEAVNAAELRLREKGRLPLHSALRSTLRSTLHLDLPLAHAFLAQPALYLRRHVAPALGEAGGPGARAAVERLADALCSSPGASDSFGVRIVVGRPIVVQRMERVSEGAVEDLAARLQRDLGELVAANGEAPDTAR